MKKLLLVSFSLFNSILLLSQTAFLPKEFINDNTGSNPYTIESGLIDNDANHDIVIVSLGGGTVEHYKGNGDGTFIKQANLNGTALNQPIGIGFGDIDGLNGNDVLIGSYGGDKIIYYQNNGDGTFAPGIDIITGIDGPTDVKVVNIDNDVNGYLDLVIPLNGPNGDTDSVIWLPGNGNGTFETAQNLIPEIAGSAPGSIDLADLDGDGDLEMVVGYIGTGTVEVYNNRLVEEGTLNFVKYDNTVSSGNTYVFYVSFGDLNDDNNLDITLADSGTGSGASVVPGRVAWYNLDDYGATSTKFTENPVPLSIDSPSTAIVTDLDDDGNNDLLVTSGGINAKRIFWFESNNDGTLKAQQIIDGTQNNTFDITVEDFDNDGDLDLASLSFGANDLTYHENILYVLGTEDYELKGISIYPNPVLDRLNFSGLNVYGNSVYVFNNVGQKIIETNLDLNNQIDVSSLNKGIYLMTIEGIKGIHKLVKN